MSGRANLILFELKRTERRCMFFEEWSENYRKLGMRVEYREYREALIHNAGRRRWLLQELLKVQLKEFNSD